MPRSSKKSSKKIQSHTRRYFFIKKIGVVFTLLVVLSLFYVVVLKWINPPFTITQLEWAFTGEKMSITPVSLSEVSKEFIYAVISAEDQRYGEHGGFDVVSIEQAIAHNRDSTGAVRGASTISQQTAKNVFLWQHRSWFRKGLEAYYTLLIEWIWGKERILEVYLNVAEMGPGIFGVESAARHYFNKSAKQLNRKESALLAACLPNPKLYNPLSPSKRIEKKSKWIESQVLYLRTLPELKKIIP